MITPEILDLCAKLESALAKFKSPGAQAIAARIRKACEPLLAPGAGLALELGEMLTQQVERAPYIYAERSRQCRLPPQRDPVPWVKGDDGRYPSWDAENLAALALRYRGAREWLRMARRQAFSVAGFHAYRCTDRDLLAAALSVANLAAKISAEEDLIGGPILPELPPHVRRWDWMAEGVWTPPHEAMWD